MESLGSTVLPIVLPPDDKARNILVRIVRDLPYAFILRESLFWSTRRFISLVERQGVSAVVWSPVGAVPNTQCGHLEFMGPVLRNQTHGNNLP